MRLQGLYSQRRPSDDGGGAKVDDGGDERLVKLLDIASIDFSPNIDIVIEKRVTTKGSFIGYIIEGYRG